MKLTQNIFIYGKSGSGKDTVTNFITDNFSYQRIRLAFTIKSIICEKYDLTFDEIEILKRKEKWLREEHHIISDYLGGEKTTLNRIKQLVDKTSMDFHLAHKSQPVVVCDVRSFNEASDLLKAGYSGIFLKRTTSEHKNSEHYTEQNIFDNGQFEQLKGLYDSKLFHVIDNFDKDLDEPLIVNESPGLYQTDGSKRQLLNIVKNNIIPFIKAESFQGINNFLKK